MQKDDNTNIKECECNQGFYSYFEFNSKKYCSKCYQMNSGVILSHNPSTFPDDINEIINILLSVFNYNEKSNKILLHLFKNCKSINEFYDLFQKIYYQNQAFFLAKEAEIVINIIEQKMLTKKQKTELQHLICARVLDYWNMTFKKHKIGPCYYGNFGEKPNKINESILFIKKNISSNNNIYKNPIDI